MATARVCSNVSLYALPCSSQRFALLKRVITLPITPCVYGVSTLRPPAAPTHSRPPPPPRRRPPAPVRGAGLDGPQRDGRNSARAGGGDERHALVRRDAVHRGGEVRLHALEHLLLELLVGLAGEALGRVNIHLGRVNIHLGRVNIHLGRLTYTWVELTYTFFLSCSSGSPAKPWVGLTYTWVELTYTWVGLTYTWVESTVEARSGCTPSNTFFLSCSSGSPAKPWVGLTYTWVELID
jgi:hypothetical protein